MFELVKRLATRRVMLATLAALALVIVLNVLLVPVLGQIPIQLAYAGPTLIAAVASLAGISTLKYLDKSA